MYASFSLRCASSSVPFLSNALLRPLPPHAFPSLKSPLPCKLRLPLKSSYTIAGGQGDLEVSVFGKQWGGCCSAKLRCAAAQPFISPLTAHSFELAVAAWHAWLVECGVLCFTVGGVPGLLLFRCAAACPVSASSSATVPQAGLLLPSCTRCTAASSSFSRSTFSSFDMLKFSLDVSLSLFLSLSLSLSLSLPLSLS